MLSTAQMVVSTAAVDGPQSTRREPPLLETEASYDEEYDRTELNS
jgi:hypothetical protein